MALYLWLTIFFFSTSLQYSHSQTDFGRCHLSSSDVPPSSSPTETVLSELSEHTNNFGFRFLEQLNSEHDDNNILFSPLSVILACGMLLEGASGQTEKQIKEVLELSSFGETSEIAFAAKELLTGYKLIENGSSDRKFSLVIGNLAMINKRVKLKEAYARSLLTYYFALAINVDFDYGSSIIDRLNSWISKKTFGKTSAALNRPPGWKTTLVLVNTVYFKGQWVQPFEKRYTFSDTFTNSDGTKSKIEMMSHAYKSFNYGYDWGKKLAILELPYHGNVSMILILPTETNTLFNLVSTLNSTELNYLISSMKQTELVVAIPKFKLEDNHALHQVLPSMGMDLPFSHLAEISNIADNASWNVSESIQKVYMEVDDEGTVAGSKTYKYISSYYYTTAYAKPIFFTVNRPFFFIIRDHTTGVNLFMGQMNKMPNIEKPESSSTKETTTKPKTKEPTTKEPTTTEPTTTEPTTTTSKRSLIPRMIQPEPVSKQQTQQLTMNNSD